MKQGHPQPFSDKADAEAEVVRLQAEHPDWKSVHVVSRRAK